jgi:hypothetical protein
MNGVRSGCFGWLRSRAARALLPALSLRILLLIALAAPCGAQYTPGSSQPYAGQIARQRSQMVLQDLGRLAPYQEGQDIIISMQLRQLVAARQKSIASHTKKLLKLAAELNAELANADSQAPTEAQLRKIAEIQKLAHSIRKDISVPITMPRNRMVPLLPAPFPPRRR